jgi:DDE superfamily endonuclease
LIWIREATSAQRYTKDRKFDKAMLAYPTEDIWNNKEASNTTDEVEQYFPGFMAFIDSTEQQIPRPVDKDRRKMYYSGGKKKRHTVKNQLMVNNRGYILYKAKHKKGKRHDYDI